MSGNNAKSTSMATIDNYAKNFISWLLGVLEDYTIIPDQVKLPMQVLLSSLLEDSGRRLVVFSAGARKKLVENNRGVNDFVRTCTQIFESTKEEQLEQVEKGIEFLETLREKITEFIEYMKTNPDKIKNDVRKFAGYVTIFLGAFYKELPPPQSNDPSSSSSDIKGVCVPEGGSSSDDS
jgi:hypothetical protein